MRLLTLIQQKKLLPRIITVILIVIIFQLALIFMGGAMHPVYMQLPDIGHHFIPNIRTWFGKAAPYVWWGGSMTEEVYGALLVVIIATTGKAMRWGIAFALVAMLHAICWHFTLLPTPPDILWKFPLETGQVPRPDDFWYSGHVGSAFLVVLYTYSKAWWVRVLAFIYLVFMVWLVLATRTHYSIDVLGGLFATYTIYSLVNRYYPFGKST